MKNKLIMLLCVLLGFVLICSFLGRLIKGEDPIHKAAYNGDFNRLKEIMKQDPNQVNVQDKLGKTPLYKAASAGHKEIVKFLINNNANIELGNDLNERPLAKAAKFARYEVVIVLLNAGADVNCRDHYRNTPLHEAVYGGDINIVKLLVSKGANIFAKNKAGNTPKKEAQKNFRKSITQYLEEQEKKEKIIE